MGWNLNGILKWIRLRSWCQSNPDCLIVGQLESLSLHILFYLYLYTETWNVSDSRDYPIFITELFFIFWNGSFKVVLSFSFILSTGICESTLSRHRRLKVIKSLGSDHKRPWMSGWTGILLHWLLRHGGRAAMDGDKWRSHAVGWLLIPRGKCRRGVTKMLCDLHQATDYLRGQTDIEPGSPDSGAFSTTFSYHLSY